MSKDAESMALCAIRYCIGRRSYIVRSGHAWARDWGRRSAWVRDVIRRDLREAAARCDRELAGDSKYPNEWLGDPHDEAGWRDVLRELDVLASAPEDIT